MSSEQTITQTDVVELPKPKNINYTFDKILQSFLYSSYAIDWRMFKEFKKDFWRQNKKY